MRPASLSVPQSTWARIQLLGFRIFTGTAVLDAARMWLYRPAWGKPFSGLVSDCLRARSTAWTSGERELIAGLTSKLNSCSFCVAIHRSVSSSEVEPEVMEAVLADWRTAPVSPRLRAMLGFIETMTLDPERLGPADGLALAAAGVDRAAALEAIHICWVFNIGNRQADAYDIRVGSPGEFARAAPFVRLLGYRVY